MTKCYVHLGKHGDLIILLPGWKKVFESTGVKPVVMVSKEFASTLEGVSYVEPWVVDLHWYGDCGKARMMAEQKFGKDNVIFPKWWDDPSFTPPTIRGDAQQLIIHGKRMKIEQGDWFSYMASQWKYAGFLIEDIMLSPVFDRRRPAYELALFQHVVRNTKPRILYCLNTGGSSPFPCTPEVEAILRDLRREFNVIDLMQVRADRIYDMLYLFEQSELIITSDTATLHLSGCCRTPYIAFIANGGGGSIPRGNCIYQTRYNKTYESINEIKSIIEKGASLGVRPRQAQHERRPAQNLHGGLAAVASGQPRP